MYQSYHDFIFYGVSRKYHESLMKRLCIEFRLNSNFDLDECRVDTNRLDHAINIELQF